MFLAPVCPQLHAYAKPHSCVVSAQHMNITLKTWMGIGWNQCLAGESHVTTDISTHIHPSDNYFSALKKNVWKLSDLPLNPNQVTISGEGQFWGPKRFVLGDVVISDGTALLRLLYFCQRCDCGCVFVPIPARKIDAEQWDTWKYEAKIIELASQFHTFLSFLRLLYLSINPSIHPSISTVSLSILIYPNIS